MYDELAAWPPLAEHRFDETVDRYRLMRTIEAMCGLPPLGRAADTVSISDIWAGG